MEFHQRLPRNKKEFVLFMAVISILSVNIIAPLITCFEAGFHLYVWKDVLKIIPFIWICVVALVLLTHKPAETLAANIIEKNNSFNANIIVNTLITVFMMSIILTVIGTWIGTRQITMELIYMFFYKWPRNFAISLMIELLIAHPIAMTVMVKLHKHLDAKQ